MKETFSEYLFRSLPEIYQTDGTDGFLNRLLSLFGEVLQEFEYSVDDIHNQLDPVHARGDLLPWLASWVALSLDETWPESRRRELIRNAVDLYKWRGTIKGIKTFVEIYTGVRPEILEPFKTGWRIGVWSSFGEDTKIYEVPENPHSFSVIVNSFQDLTAEQKQKIMAVIELQKPAHTKVIHYVWFASYWHLGVRSTVGVDIIPGG